MPSSFLEIIQLANGEIVLQRADGEGEPLVNIRFSEESREYIGEAELDIAKVMIQAGIQATAHIHEASSTDLEGKESDESVSSDRSPEDVVENEERTLH